jgi:MerR family transcriptional regulator, light-induced transcriptional regulator
MAEMSPHQSVQLRIGELGRRVGVSPELLRVWERRYGLLRPTRASNGYRLYSPDDLRRATEMQAHIARGVAPSQAAELAKAEAAGDRASGTAEFGSSALLARIREALDRYDGAAGERLVDRALVNLGLGGAIQEVVFPYLDDLGDRWARGEISVAHEHFASNVVRKRLLRLADHWERSNGPVALLACAPGEQHDIGLVCFGLSIYSYHGWRVKYLGADTPIGDLARAATMIRPDVVVASAVTPARFFTDLPRWAELAREFRVGIGGGGATARLARQIGAGYLSGDPVVAAARVAEGR